MSTTGNTPTERLEAWFKSVHPAAWCVGAALVLAPTYSSDFILTQIFCWAFILGTIGLSLMFLAGYGGMVSLAQMTTAGAAGYAVALLGPSGSAVSLALSAWIYIPLSIICAMVLGMVVGAVSVRTQGIYTVMITLAISAAFFYFTSQNQEVFNGSRGFNAITAPKVFGVDWQSSIPFYYLSLCIAFLTFLLVTYVSRTPFGLALQGIRDNPRRMGSLGFNVTAHRVLAYAMSAFIAALGGVLLVWFNRQISPGTVAIGPAIDILVVAVVGGLTLPIGPFIGAFIFVLLRTFALDIFQAFGFTSMRFNLLVGLGFLAIVMFSPDGVLGLWKRWRHLIDRRTLSGLQETKP
ncbi:branched-chain amino acid ABC transporter permease [Agrobacterium sp. NPDC058088]|uniref:branched-chain amino acid ABC transporter permease n=1 Tax=Agrobacterium sp. NPDC058088 TaxID=3346335 RepID=UPI0036DBB203